MEKEYFGVPVLPCWRDRKNADLLWNQKCVCGLDFHRLEWKETCFYLEQKK